MGDFDTHIGIGIDTAVKYSTTRIICVDTMEPIPVVHVLYVHDSFVKFMLVLQ